MIYRVHSAAWSAGRSTARLHSAASRASLAAAACPSAAASPTVASPTPCCSSAVLALALSRTARSESLRQYKGGILKYSKIPPLYLLYFKITYSVCLLRLLTPFTYSVYLLRLPTPFTYSVCCYTAAFYFHYHPSKPSCPLQPEVGTTLTT